jgi:hypothetical protein
VRERKVIIPFRELIGREVYRVRLKHNPCSNRHFRLTRRSISARRTSYVDKAVWESHTRIVKAITSKDLVTFWVGFCTFQCPG